MSKNNKQKAASIMKQLKEVPGLFSALIEHKVIETSAQIKWDGPKIPPEEWNKVLAFFQWTYDESKSESQVRLYVNPRQGTWKAWAYPQEAKSGMSARELGDDPKFAEQRLQFNPSDGWLYFATAHHHCSAGAFQSSVDEDNEKGQDGLHITVGNMDKPSYELHDRFYLGGQLIDHDLSWFYDIGNALDDVPNWAMQFVPKDIQDRLARGAMCKKAPPETVIPQEWKDNLIYKKWEATKITPYNGGLGYCGGWDGGDYGYSNFQRTCTNCDFDLKKAAHQLKKLIRDMNMEVSLAGMEMKSIIEDPFLMELTHLVYRNDVSVDKLLAYIIKHPELVIDDEPSEIEKDAAEAIKAIQEGSGIPTYKGNLPE